MLIINATRFYDVNLFLFFVFLYENSASFYAISRNGDPCNCSTSGAGVVTFRPDIGDGNWGGFDGATCGAATQTIVIDFVEANRKRDDKNKFI